MLAAETGSVPPPRGVVGVTAGKYRESVEEIRGTLLNLGGGNRIPLSEGGGCTGYEPGAATLARLDGGAGGYA